MILRQLSVSVAIRPDSHSAERKDVSGKDKLRHRNKVGDRPANDDAPDRVEVPEAEKGAQTGRMSAERFPIVGIGASAGGLDACRRLLQALPADTGMAFVLVQHLHPDYPSQLAEILSRSTAMPVMEVQDEPAVQPNHVYIIPSARSMVIDRDGLNLHPRSEIRGMHRPVNAFFRSLAEFHGNCAIGVLLSGTGSDGVEGMEEIKAEGGITFAQDASAQYDGMPGSAIASGCVDFVLPPEKIAEELVRIARHPYVMTAADAGVLQGDRAIDKILRMVHQATSVDFTHYKSTTLHRRLTRRMLLHGLDSNEDYLRFLREHPAEVQDLYRDFLINVTSFFRDPESFDTLARTAFPRLFADRAMDDPVRVWVLGCATGEEAYSIAIGLHEFASREHTHVAIQVFATDLSEKGIEFARAGHYSRDIEHHVSPERLKRYFELTEDGYRICKTIRELCVFARQNVLSDPPFSRMDLISCRNLLIYLEPVLQQRVLPLFHYALKPNGYLWLGSAETIGAFDDLFEVCDAKHRIYQGKSAENVLGVAAIATRVQKTSRVLPIQTRPSDPGPLREPLRDSDRILLARYAPPAVLVNSDLEVVQFRGDTSPFLQMGSGKPSLHLFKMTREGLLVVLRLAMERAENEDLPITESGSFVDGNGLLQPVDVDVIPVQGDSRSQRHYLVVFRPQRSATAVPPPPAESEQAGSRDGQELNQYRLEHARLIQELHATRDYLHALLEQRDIANEELQSANEEAQSSNEELQSINEELQTTKEEMESANEELLSVNDELIKRHDELAQANDDLSNIMASTQMALVTVGPDLRIRRFTPAAELLLNLIAADVGRPLGDLKLTFDIGDIEAKLLDSMKSIAVPDREVRDRRGRWYSMRMRPYRTADGKIDGAVLIFVNIDVLKQSEASLRESQQQFRLLMEGATGIAILLLDAGGQIVGWNTGAQRLFQYEEAEIRGRHVSMLYREDDAHVAHEELELAVRKGVAVEEHYMRRRDGSLFWTAGVMTVLRDENGQARGYSKVVSDVSDKHRMAEARQVEEQRKDEFLSVLAHELRNPLAPIRSSLYLLDNPRITADDARLARDVIKRQVTHMVRLVEDLLDVARIAKGRIEFRPEPIDLASVIETAVESAHPSIEAAAQVLEIDLPPKPLLLYADHARLAQAVSNILLNASRYTPDHGHIRLTVEGAHDNCLIRVADDGIGIDPDQQKKVFDLFAQADHVPGRIRDGLGIGLSMVKALVEMHDGRVEVKSDGRGHGSEFSIVLPMRSRDGRHRRSNDANERLPAGQRILVVDDNRDAADSVARILSLEGHEVRTAYDGASGYDLAAANKPDIALIDLGMPLIDGHSLCRKLRATTWGSKMLLVALTGWGQDSDKRASMDVGFDAHLTKPVDPEQLSMELQAIASRKVEHAHGAN
jgi:two-component system CheB/CheR fusion protein